MYIGSLILNTIISIILTAITICSIVIVYEVCKYLCCCCPKPMNPESNKTETSPNMEHSVASLSTSNSNSNSTNKTNRNNKSNLSTFFSCATITTCILFCITCVSVNFDRIQLLSQDNQRKSWAIGGIIWSGYFIGRLIISLIFIRRLCMTFQGSAFQFTQSVINTLNCMWFSMILFTISAFALTSVRSLVIYGVIIGCLYVIIDVALSCTLLYLYSKKLFVLVSNKDTQLLALMTKYALLYTIYFISSFIVFLTLAISPMFLSAAFQAYLWIVVSLDSLINIICVWLKFAFAEKWYFKLCMYCNNKYKLCCNNCTNNGTDEMMIHAEIQATTSASIRSTSPDSNDTITNTATDLYAQKSENVTKSEQTIQIEISTDKFHNKAIIS
eukprot:100993_1